MAEVAPCEDKRPYIDGALEDDALRGLLGSWEVRKAWLSRSQPARVLETSVRTGFCVASYSLRNGNLL